MADILDDFDWDAFEKRNSFQMSEKQNEGTVDVIEHTVVSVLSFLSPNEKW